jgi:hypothetical protein
MDTVQKVNNCINMASSQTFSSYLRNESVRQQPGDEIGLCQFVKYLLEWYKVFKFYMKTLIKSCCEIPISSHIDP